MSRFAAAVAMAFLLVQHGSLAQQSAASDGSPFALHLGPAYARIPDADFETVLSLSGQDLFARVDARENTTDFGVFASQRLWSGGSAGPRVYATVGTGVSRPGRVLYMGGSLGASRALVTLGLATAPVDTGLQPVPDLIFRGNQERTLFGSLERRREWGFFMSVSFGLIQ